MVVVGFLIALLMLHGRSEEILRQNSFNARLLGAGIEAWLTQHQSAPETWPKKELMDLIGEQQLDLKFDAVQIVSGNTTIRF